MIKVKTVYEATYDREPNISEYKTKEEADRMIKTTLEWGVGIVSCETVD